MSAEFPIGSVWRADCSTGEAWLLVVDEERPDRRGQHEVSVLVLANEDPESAPPGVCLGTWTRNFDVWERVL